MKTLTLAHPITLFDAPVGVITLEFDKDGISRN